MFLIADQRRVLEDYVKHRSTFEIGREVTLHFSEPQFLVAPDAQIALWEGVDDVSGRLVQHKAVLVSGLLADFAYEATGMTAQEFERSAQEILGSISVTN